MKIKRIIAADMRGAMRQVRQIFGDEAVILSNRNCPEGVEVIAAMDFDEKAIRLAAAHQAPHRVSGPAPTARPQPARAPEERLSLVEDSVPESPVAAAAPEAPAPEPGPAGTEAEKAAVETSTAVEPETLTAEAEQQAFAEALAQFQEARTPTAEAANESVSEPVDTMTQRPARGSVGLDAASGESDWAWLLKEQDSESELNGLREEVGMLRELFERQLSVLEWHRYAREHPREIETSERLQALGLPVAMARSLARDAVKSEPERALASALRSFGHQMEMPSTDLVDDGGIYALVGPTGVGKTTTLAKLAARAVLNHGRESVALITTDRFRIGAQEQLRNYARILNVPLHVARDERHLGELLDAVSDRHLVLVDTAGMSQRDFRMLSTLEKMPQIDSRLKMILVLSANAQYATQSDIIRSFGILPLAGMVLTKLDETVLLGSALAALVSSELPLMCAGVGQRVPEDLWLPTAADLIRQAIEQGQAERVREEERQTQASKGAVR